MWVEIIACRDLTMGVSADPSKIDKDLGLSKIKYKLA